MMRVSLISHTPEPEKVVAAAYKICYSGAGLDDLLDGLTPEKSREFVTRLAGLGHDSTTEHASFTFAIEGVSRSLLAEITRHRMASFSVQSQRYVRLDNFEHVTPPEIAEIPEAREIFERAMEQDTENYEQLTALLREKHLVANLAKGLPEKEARQKAEKGAIEDARFVFPNACTTKMIVTMNARSLNNFFRLRCCNRAQWEIRTLAKEMLKLVYAVAPSLFLKAGPGCVRGACPEGAMTCGEIEAVRAEYRCLKGQEEGGR